MRRTGSAWAGCGWRTTFVPGDCEGGGDVVVGGGDVVVGEGDGDVVVGLGDGDVVVGDVVGEGVLVGALSDVVGNGSTGSPASADVM